MDDQRFNAPAAPGLDIIIPGLSMTLNDEQTVALCGPVQDGLDDSLE
ncbi:hypothetical protein [Arthrobacter sp. FB24]|nr:hypothetical protein [Arthrobacter sp. FB24]